MALPQIEVPKVPGQPEFYQKQCLWANSLKIYEWPKGYHAVTIWENRIHDLKHAVSKKAKERVFSVRRGMILQDLTFVLNWRIWVWWLMEGIEDQRKWRRDRKASSKCCDASLSRTGCYIHGWGEGGIENKGLEANSHCKAVLFQAVGKKKSNTSFVWHMFENVIL